MLMISCSEALETRGLSTSRILVARGAMHCNIAHSAVQFSGGVDCEDYSKTEPIDFTHTTRRRVRDVGGAAREVHVRFVVTRSRVGTTRCSNAAASDADGSTVDRRRLLPCPASDGIASSGVCHCRAISVQALPDPRNTASVSRTIRLLRRLAPSEPSSSGS